MSIRDAIAILKLPDHVASQRIQDVHVFFQICPISNEVFSCEQEKESIIRVRVG